MGKEPPNHSKPLPCALFVEQGRCPLFDHFVLPGLLQSWPRNPIPEPCLAKRPPRTSALADHIFV